MTAPVLAACILGIAATLIAWPYGAVVWFALLVVAAAAAVVVRQGRRAP